MSIKNRPLLKKDANNNELQWSYMDMAKRWEGSGGIPKYFGLARPGSQDDEPVWKIEKYTGDENTGGSQWPKDELGRVSSQYEFKWSDREKLTFV